MIDTTQTEVAALGVRLLDDAYLAWFSAESECERALHAWFQGTGEQRTTAYLSYRAALDREEAAASDLQRPWLRSQPCRDSFACRQESVVE